MGERIKKMIRTNIELNEKLLEEGLKLSSYKTKKELVNKALEDYVKKLRRKGLLKYSGSGIWQGDLEKSRKSRI